MSRLLVFDRNFQCRLDRISRLPSGPPSSSPPEGLSEEESMQLIMGMCYSLKNMLGKLAKSPGSDTTFSYRTPAYRLHYYEVASGWRFVLLVAGTLPVRSCVWAGHTVTLESALAVFYREVFLEWVLRNPLLEDPVNLGGAKTGRLDEAVGGVGVKIAEFMQLPIFG